MTEPKSESSDSTSTDTYKFLLDQLNEMKDQRDSWIECAKTLETALAEADRTAAKQAHLHDLMAADKREIERLREALKRIEGLGIDCTDMRSADKGSRCPVCIAEAALEPKP